MATIGLFTRAEVKAKAFAPSGRAHTTLPAERLWEIGLKGVDRMNPHAKTRHMEPSGSDHPDIYLLGEAPGETEDRDGEPFVGASGALLRRHLPRRANVRFNNVVRTLPVRRGKTRAPSFHEIECYRRSVEADIERTKPKIVYALGGIPFHWGTGLSDAITFCRGRRYPVRIGSHECWLYASLHPAYVLRVVDEREMTDGVPGPEWEHAFKRDLERAFRDLPDLAPPRVTTAEEAWEGVEACRVGRIEVAREFLRSCLNEELVGLDFETNRLRPYEKGAKILTCGIATKRRALAFPIDHPQSGWTQEQRHILVEHLHALFLAPTQKTVHNLAFDLEWALALTNNPQILLSRWECSQAQAYCLDERFGGQSLNSLCVQHFGLRMKSLSHGTRAEGLFGATGEIDRLQLERTDVKDVCRYNALDAKFHRKLYCRQLRALDDGKLRETYEEHILKVPALVFAQREGLPVDHAAVKSLKAEWQQQVDEREALIRETKAARLFKRKQGRPLNPASPDDLVVLFRDLLRRTEGTRGKKYSTDQAALGAMSDEPIAGLVLKWREATKLIGTYLDPLDITVRDTVLFPDGRIHAVFRHTETDTSRLCVSGDTLLETSLGQFRIADLDLRSLGQNCTIRTHEDRWKPIKRKWYKGRERMLRIEFDSGAHIDCTAGHKLLTPIGWVSAGTLRVNSEAVGDPSFEVAGYNRTICCLSEGGTDHTHPAGTGICRVPPVAVLPERSLGKTSWRPLQGCDLLEVLVPPPIRSGLEGSVTKKLLVIEDGEHSRGKAAKGIAQQNGDGGKASSGLHQVLSGQAFWGEGTHDLPESAVSWDFCHECRSSTLLRSNQTGLVGVGRNLPRTSGEAYVRHLPEEPGASRNALLANFREIACCGETIEEGRATRKQSQSKRPTSVLVDESRGDGNCVGVAKTENSVRSSVVVRWSKEVDGGFHVTRAEGGDRSRWGSTSESVNQGQGWIARRGSRRDRLSSAALLERPSSSAPRQGSRGSFVIRVIRITDLPAQEVWDIEVEGDHSYFAQGLIHHNSAAYPSVQNWPKRKHAEIRRTVAAPEGWVMISADYGRQEFGTIGMLSLDEVVVKACWDDYDVHMVWAKEIQCAYPKTFAKRHGKTAKTDEKKAWKDWRNEVKNQFVFPYFFGSSYRSMARNLDMPDDALLPIYNKMKRYFGGVSKWQDEVIGLYEREGYSTTLAGHRRRYPLSKNQAINHPVQGTAAEMTANAMHRLTRRAIETKRYYQAPVLQIHDDLDFFTPRSKAVETIGVIARVMCDLPFTWAKVVPIVVEVSAGPNWYELKKVGEFRSDKLDEQLKGITL